MTDLQTEVSSRAFREILFRGLERGPERNPLRRAVQQGFGRSLTGIPTEEQ